MDWKSGEKRKNLGVKLAFIHFIHILQYDYRVAIKMQSSHKYRE